MDSSLDKKLQHIDNELAQLKAHIKSSPNTTLTLTQQYLERVERIPSPEHAAKALIIMSLCAWHLNDYHSGLKYIKTALLRQKHIDNNSCLPEIFHIHALHLWEQSKYYSAQQFWINGLELSTLLSDVTMQIKCLIGLGNTKRVTGEPQKAYLIHELACTIANNNRLHCLEVPARAFLAWDHYLLHNYVEMLSVLDGAIELFNHHQDPSWQAKIWDFKSLALLNLEQIDEAQKTSDIAKKLNITHDFGWINIQILLTQAQLELKHQSQYQDVDKQQHILQLLEQAKEAAIKSKNNNLLVQVYAQQIAVAEKYHDYLMACQLFKSYRQYSLIELKIQATQTNVDKARFSSKQQDLRSNQLLNHIRKQYTSTQFLRGVSESFWWEQLVSFKMALGQANYTVIIIQHANPLCLEICMELAHCLCQHDDFLSQLSDDRLGLLLRAKGEEAQGIFNTLQTMLKIFPWQRRGLSNSSIKISLYDILSFPFTLEQLDELSEEGY